MNLNFRPDRLVGSMVGTDVLPLFGGFPISFHSRRDIWAKAGVSGQIGFNQAPFSCPKGEIWTNTDYPS